jgi:hypothetical protein
MKINQTSQIFMGLSILFLLLLSNCGVSPSSIKAAVTPKPSMTFAPISAPTTNQISVPVVGANSKMIEQCLDVAPALSDASSYKGLLILKERFGDNTKPGVTTLDTATGKTKVISLDRENQIGHVVSPDQTLMAYTSILFDEQENIIKEELVVADANGTRLMSMPWGETWHSIAAWLNESQLVISLILSPEQNSGQKPAALLVLDPFTGEQKLLDADLPGYIHESGLVVPYWDGWLGAVYDSTGSLAVYPAYFGTDPDKFTYAVWDASKEQMVVSLENVFAVYDIFPQPRWSPDNSQFVFNGLVNTDNGVAIELYRVSRGGQIEQLTELSPTAYVLDSGYSWSPEGRFIALLLITKEVFYPKALVALLDTVTLQVTNYCLPVSYGGALLSPPVWSPDGRQFLVTDWYDDGHQRIIMIDIEKNIAAQIAEDMELIGWMVKP